MGHKIRQVDELKVELFSISLELVIISSSAIRTLDDVGHYVNFVWQARPGQARPGQLWPGLGW